MKKYMYIDCCERDIGTPEFFDDFDEAKIYLFKKWCEFCRYIDTDNWDVEVEDMDELEEILEGFVQEEIIDDQNDYNYTDAWCEIFGSNNWDGKIIEVEI